MKQLTILVDGRQVFDSAMTDVTYTENEQGIKVVGRYEGASHDAGQAPHLRVQRTYR
jgi:hypothetical protein